MTDLTFANEDFSFGYYPATRQVGIFPTNAKSAAKLFAGRNDDNFLFTNNVIHHIF